MGLGKEFKFHSAFNGELGTDFNQGGNVIESGFEALFWSKDVEWIGRQSEQTW